MIFIFLSLAHNWLFFAFPLILVWLVLVMITICRVIDKFIRYSSGSIYLLAHANGPSGLNSFFMASEWNKTREIVSLLLKIITVVVSFHFSIVKV